MRIRSGWLLVLALVAAFNCAASEPPPGCLAFKWDVSRELDVLSTRPLPVAASDGVSPDRPRIEPGRLYRAELLPQAQVTLAARPGKPTPDDGAHAGLLFFRVAVAGRYRVSITTAHWIDVVADGQALPSLDFQGRRDCPLVHKIVEFELPADRDLVLQFAGGTAPQVGVAITAVSP